jgi:hypothetical protein
MQSSQPPAAVVVPQRSVLPQEDDTFSALVAGSCAGAAEAKQRVEVRVHTLLSSLRLHSPVQFGLFAQVAIAAGEEVTPYGGIVRSHSDVRQLPAELKTHIRSIRSSFVLDGLPLANMLDRPVPHSMQTLHALAAEGVHSRQPTPSRFVTADLERFAASAFGFMANTERCWSDGPSLGVANIRVQSRPVRLAGITYDLPVLVASRAIQPDEEIISPYGKQASPEPPAPHPSDHMKSHLWTLLPPTAESIAAAAEWLTWGQCQPDTCWEPKRNAWQQLTAAEDDDADLWERGRVAGRSCLRVALLDAAYNLRMSSQKLLRSHPGEGLQDDHCDAATLEAAEGSYSVLIYLTAGESTAVPTTPGSHVHSMSWTMNAAAATAARKSIQLTTHAVQPGAAMVLSHKLLHHAPCNNTNSDRVVLFQHWILKTRVAVPDSEQQRVPFGISQSNR